MDTGDRYTGLPVCLELWVDDRMLRGVVHVKVPPPDALADVSEDFPGRQQRTCNGIGATMTAEQPVADVTSQEALRLRRPVTPTLPSEQFLWLRIERVGNELIGSLCVEQFRISLSVTKTN